MKCIFTKNEKIKQELKQEIIDVQNKLLQIREKYNLAQDDLIIESLIYEEKSLLKKYEFLIKEIKNNYH